METKSVQEGTELKKNHKTGSLKASDAKSGASGSKMLSCFFMVLCFLLLFYSGVNGRYESFAGKKFHVKGEVVGIIREDAGITVILKTDKGENVLVIWDEERFSGAEDMFMGGNNVKVIVEVLEDGVIQGISAEKIARVVSSKKYAEDSYGSYKEKISPWSHDFSTLEIYKKTVQYFNSKLSDRDAERIASSILTYSKLHKIDPRLVIAVIAVESDFCVNACSVKGAIGLGQLMPQTAKILKVNPLNIEENILGTASYLKFCLEQWKDYPYLNLRLAIASYNAGPGVVAKYGGVPPYIETQNYVKKVMDLYKQLCSK
jgi:hypothetical protein